MLGEPGKRALNFLYFFFESNPIVCFPGTLGRGKSMQLSEVECRFFDEQGYIQLEGLVDGEELLQLQQEFTRVEKATREELAKATGGRYRPRRLRNR